MNSTMTGPRRRWPWVLLFVVVIMLITTLATSWNWVLVQHYNGMIQIAKGRWSLEARGFNTAPWLSITLGSLGFTALIVFIALLFAKILREMKLNQLQRDFLANMSHELKTPLASLSLSCGLLKKDEGLSDEDRRELWSAHDMELARLREEIERLLTASRWEQFQDRPSFADLDLETWLRDAMPRWQRLLPASAELTREGDALSGIARLDTGLLTLISSNLIDNARKFSGPRPPRIKILSKRDGSSWSLRFEDQGLGFDPRDASKIFRRFQRLSHRADHAIPGTGLGLHLALSASVAMNLELSASSEGPDLGACFTLRGLFVSPTEVSR